MARIAILGLGSIGRRHARNLMAFGIHHLIGFDPSESAIDGAHRECGLTTTAVLSTVWDFAPDVVFVTAPSHRHVALALDAAKRGCDLFIEKPLSNTLDGLEELSALARQHRLVTMVGCNMRFHPGPATVRRLILDGAIGDVIAARIHTGSYLPTWRPGTAYTDSYSSRREEGGGAVLDCIHELDLALWYFGSAELIASTVRPARSLGLTVDGLAEIWLEHRGGVFSSVHLNYVQRDYLRFCQVIGTTGTLYWSFDVPQIELRSEAGHRYFDLPAGWSADRMFIDEASEFLRCVRERTPAPNAIEEAEQTLRLALLARGGAAELERRSQ